VGGEGLKEGGGVRNWSEAWRPGLTVLKGVSEVTRGEEKKKSWKGREEVTGTAYLTCRMLWTHSAVV